MGTTFRDLTFLGGRAGVRLMSDRGSSGEIIFANVWKAFGSDEANGVLALRDVTLTVPAGEFVCLIGPSGCGKSTLLNMVAGIVTPSKGEVRYDGSLVTGLNKRVGYMTQDDNLLPWWTVEQNVGLPLEIRGVPKDDRKKMVAEMLEKVGLGGFAHLYPSQLSGGMRKRAALARLLIYGPETLLMDEPFGPLDAQMRVIMQQELLRLWERDRKTVLFVTHDLEEAITLSDRVVVMGTNPGRIIHIEEIPFPRPRDIMELRQDPAFHSIWRRLWGLIELQVHEHRSA